MGWKEEATSMRQSHPLGLAALVVTAVLGMLGGEVAATVITHWSGHGYFDAGSKGSGNRWYRGKSSSSGIATDWTVDIDGDGNTDDDQLSYYAFSLVDPLNPLLAAQSPYGRYRTDKHSAVFYGGIVARYGNTRTKPFQQATIEDERDVSKITSVAYMTEWDTGWEEPVIDDLVTYDAVFVWQKDGFLNGGDVAAVSFDETSLLSMQLRRNFDLWRGDGEMRWVVRDGEQFYMSEDQLIKTSKWGLDYNSVVPTETLWAPYDPVGPIDIDFEQHAASFAPYVFTDVTAVGFYHERDTPSNDSDHMKLYDFRVEGTLTIPSPATAWLAWGTTVGWLLGGRAVRPRSRRQTA